MKGSFFPSKESFDNESEFFSVRLYMYEVTFIGIYFLEISLTEDPKRR